MIVDVTPVQYRPHDAEYRLDVEVIPAQALRERVASNPRRGFERVDFHCLLFVRAGSYSHTIDFETHACTAGSCLVVGPGQVHRFGPPSDWDGWIAIVAPHHVPHEIERLPSHIRTTERVASAIVELFERMTDDATFATEADQLDDVLGTQAQLLVKRLALCQPRPLAGHLVDPAIISRYRAYRAAVDGHFRQWHLVTPYARHLGYSTKSLDRACLAVSDVTAKRIIVERIVLEAKRVLAHSSDSVARVSDDLGFDEPTNFVKYFRRATNLTPTQFRNSLLSTAPRSRRRQPVAGGSTR